MHPSSIPSAPPSRLAAVAGWRDRVKRRVYEVVELSAPDDRLGSAFDLVILALIFANVAALVLETVPSLNREYGAAFAAFETASVAVFSVEYLLRLWTADLSPRFAGRVRGRLRYAATPMAVLDLLSVLPYWLAFTAVDLRILRALRLFRVFRLAKLIRYSAALQAFLRVMRAKREELVVCMGLIVVMLFWASALMYYAERDAQPDRFSSIPAAMWWAICTLTTVGYGDVYPVTALGKMVASAIALMGIGFFALPTGLLGAEFVAEIQRKRAIACPHCGKEIHGGHG